MTNSTPNPVPRAWKQTESPGTPVDGAQPWRRETAAEQPRFLRRSRGRRLLLAFLLFTALCGLLVWVSLWLHSARGTSLLIVTAGYEDNLAIDHNTYGRAGGEGLADLARSNPPGTSMWSSGTLQLRTDKPRLLETVDGWDQDLKGRFSEKTLLLYCAVHGGADARGAFLIPQKTLAPEAADAGDPTQNVLRIEDILTRLSKLPASRNVVLVLDCTQLTSNLRLGMLHNGFAEELDKLDQKIAAIPNLIVLCASSQDQRSWASDDLGKTVFSYFVIEGLKGDADGAASEDGTRDGRINAFELHRYVSDHVSEWVWRNRAAQQTPTLFPKGKLGEERARAMHLTVVPKSYVAPTPRPRPLFVPPPSLMETWKRRDQLAAMAPPPSAYAPQLWRLYQDLLLRSEELLQGGERTVSRSLMARLRDVEQGILLAQKLDLDSQGNTLTMPAVARAWASPDKETHEALNRLWDAQPQNVAKEWASLQQQAEKTDKSRVELLRLQLCDLALTRCAENPSNYLKKTIRLLQLLDSPLSPRAAEAHFAVMLHRDLLRSEPGNLGSPLLLPARYLKTALEVRQRAERAALGLQAPGTPAAGGPYCYAEQVTPWLRETVARADGLRQSGHDLLFSSDAANWDKGRDLLVAADTQYEQAQADAACVRLALAVRDRVLPVLPYYSRWLAASALEQDDGKPGRDEKHRQLALELWSDVHALVELLEKTPIAAVNAVDFASKRGLVLQSIAEITEHVQLKFATIENGFADSCLRLEEVANAGDWHSLNDVLAIPAIDASLRAQLLTRRSRLSRDLFNAALQLAAASDRLPLSDNGQRNRSRVSGVWQGRLTLAGLGKRWFEDQNTKTCGNYEDLQKQLASIAETEDRAALGAVGAAIGSRCRTLPLEVNKRTTAAQKSDPAGNLRAADRLQRLLDGAGSLQVTQNPSRLYRQRLVQDLLLWQSQRTLLDHWAGEDPSVDPYFKVAGRVFLKDAKRLLPLHERLGQAEKQLNQEQKLTVALTRAPGLRAGGTANPVLHWTSEDEFPLQFRLGTAALVAGLSGYPLAWVETSDNVEVVGVQAGQRIVQTLDGMADHPLMCSLRAGLIRAGEAKAPALPAPADGKVILHGLFRGQHLQLETRVLIHPTAETVMTTHPLPAAAAVAIRAPRELHAELGTSSGAVVIVLDCTGSMGAREGQPVEGSKYHEAVMALKQVLPRVPRGTMLSVWIFGQAVGANKTVTNPTETIEQLQPPISWNPEDTDKINALVAKALAFEPWNLSPIFRAMYTAAQKDLARASGFKSMMVITDGMDNCFDKDVALHGGKKDTRTFLLDNFADVQVNVIGFKFASREEEEARQQFAAIAELPNKGQFFTVNDSRDLVFRIQKLLPQKLHYTISTQDDRPFVGLAGGGLDVSQSGQGDQWLAGGMPPGAYKVHLGGAFPLTQSIALNRGDLLLLELGYDLTGKQILERVMYSESDFPWAISKAKEGWRFGVLQNQRLKDGGLQMLMTLEKQADARTALLQMARPAKVWMEVTPPDAAALYTSRWHYQPGYPAPAWNLDVPAWPTTSGGKSPARPTARVWWSPERVDPPAVSLERTGDLVDFRQLANRMVRVEEEDVVIESVTVEDHLVELQAGSRGAPGQLKKMPCLVVRVAHGRNNPVWLSIRGLEAAGQEHRFYTSAGKYTAIFWPVTADQAGAALTGIDVHSLKAFKRDAEQQKCMLELRNLYEPLTTELRPMQPAGTSALTSGPGDRLPAALPLPEALDAKKR